MGNAMRIIDPSFKLSKIHELSRHIKINKHFL